VIVSPTYDRERELLSQGYRLIAGVDEVGRGCIAGPVVAAAVVLPSDGGLPWLGRVRDSKQLSPRQREALLGEIRTCGAVVGVGSVPHNRIDEMGIVAATRLAMAIAVEELAPTPDFLLIDALRLPEVRIPQQGLVRGDQLCCSIACASIVAKVTRDRYMQELDAVYPGYGLAVHKGYPTALHVASLERLGASPVHRRSFAPVRRLL